MSADSTTQPTDEMPAWAHGLTLQLGNTVKQQLVESQAGHEKLTTGLRQEITGLRQEITEVRQAQAAQETLTTGLRQEITGLRQEITEVRQKLEEHGVKLDVLLQRTSIGAAAKSLERYLFRVNPTAAYDGTIGTFTGVHGASDGVRYLITALHCCLIPDPSACSGKHLKLVLPRVFAECVDGVGLATEWLSADGWKANVEPRVSDFIVLRLRDGVHVDGMPTEFVDLSGDNGMPPCFTDLVGLSEGGMAVTGRVGDMRAVPHQGPIPMTDTEGCVPGSSGTLMFQFTKEGVSAPVGLYGWHASDKRSILVPVPKLTAASDGPLPSELAADGPNDALRFVSVSFFGAYDKMLGVGLPPLGIIGVPFNNNELLNRFWCKVATILQFETEPNAEPRPRSRGCAADDVPTSP